MAQLDFFLCKEERLEFVNHVLNERLLLIPDLAYDLAKPTIISSISEYETIVDTNILIFLINSKEDIRYFDYSSFEKNGENKLYIRQRYGMPNIHFLSCGLVEHTENKIAPSSLSNYPFYYNKKQDKIYPDEKDKLIYKNLSAFVKKRTVPAKFIKRTFFVGKRSIVLCETGKYQLVNIGNVNPIDLVK